MQLSAFAAGRLQTGLRFIRIPINAVIGTVQGASRCSTMSERKEPDRQADTAETWLPQTIEVASHDPVGLNEGDLTNVKELFGRRISRNTRTTYQGQWRRFERWAREKGLLSIPASPEVVSAYLAGLMQNEGRKPATLKAAASAIGYVHRAIGLEDPCASTQVRGVLSGAVRKMGKTQKQAEALTAEALAKIHSVVYEPRTARGGRTESREEARRRGSLDMALMSLMRDGLLRVSEAEALIWRDLESVSDGTGRLHVQRSKSDQDGEGAVMYISAPTMVFMEAIRCNAAPGDSIFGLRRKQMTNRIKRAAELAGLGDRFSGHSPRVGMARDLARAGCELSSLMNAGRWSSPTMPALYTRNERAARGAVAIYYGQSPTVAA